MQDFSNMSQEKVQKQYLNGLQQVQDLDQDDSGREFDLKHGHTHVPITLKIFVPK